MTDDIREHLLTFRISIPGPLRVSKILHTHLCFQGAGVAKFAAVVLIFFLVRFTNGTLEEMQQQRKREHRQIYF